MGIPLLERDGRTLDPTLYNYRRAKWIQAVWYGRQADLLSTQEGRALGDRIEAIALRRVLPAVGVAVRAQLSVIAPHAPFDFLGVLRGTRIAIDVTAKWQKRVDKKAPMAEAFGLPLYLLHISPRDPGYYFFVEVSPSAKSVRVPMEILSIMASEHGELTVRQFFGKAA